MMARGVIAGAISHLWLLAKVLFSGLLGAILGWVIILSSLAAARSVWLKRELDTTQPYAVAGTWEFALHQPFVPLLLGACFALGVWLHLKQQTWVLFAIAVICRFALWAYYRS